MKDIIDYEEPKLLELDAMFLQGDTDHPYEDASTAKFEASYDEEYEHETMEL